MATVYDTDESWVIHYVSGEPVERQRLKRFAAGMLKIGNWTCAERGKFATSTDACMDELIVFDKALNDQEVRLIYEVGRP